MIESADFVIDLGPGAGEHGGALVTSGPPHSLALRNDALTMADNGFAPISYTAHYLQGLKTIPVPSVRRSGNGKAIVLEKATGNNLAGVTLRLPLGKLIAVTGVSGSGKSTLIDETLYRILARKFYKAKLVPLPHKAIRGLEHIDKVIDIDQIPDRPYAPLEPGNIHRSVRSGARSVRTAAGSADTRVQTGPVQFQCGRRTV